MATKTVREHFARWSDYLARAEAPTDMANDRRASLHNYDESGRWAGTKSLDEALQLARTGWEEGANKARAFTGLLVDRIVGRIEREDVVYDVEGMGFDVARVIQGEPECWIRYEPTREVTERPGKECIRLLVSVNACHTVAGRTLIAKGSVIAALVELLEFAGHNVEVTVVLLADSAGKNASGMPTHRHIMSIRVKDFGQPLDMGMIAYATAHPSMPRRIGFAVMERLPKDMRDGLEISISGRYGIPKNLPAEEQAGYLYIGAAQGNETQWTDANVAERWIIDQLEEHGITLRDITEQGL